jgi:hypothetical protein
MNAYRRFTRMQDIIRKMYNIRVFNDDFKIIFLRVSQIV